MKQKPKSIKSPLLSAGVEFVSLQECVDTATSGGKLVFHVFGALAEFEREMFRERTRAGLKAARARGISNGRPKKLTGDQVQMARTLMKYPANKSSEICQTLKISRSTLYGYCLQAEKSRNESVKLLFCNNLKVSKGTFLRQFIISLNGVL